MQRSQRHLGGPDQVEVVLGQAVDLLLGVGKKSRSEERPLANQHGRDDRFEALRAQPLERVADQRQLD